MFTVYQLLAHGRWFTPGTPLSSTTKTVHHDIGEALLKVALSTKKNKDEESIKCVPITTKAVSSNPVHSEVFLIQHYVIMFVSDLRKVSCFLWVPRFLHQ
jgi:hypothetical protein